MTIRLSGRVRPFSTNAALFVVFAGYLLGLTGCSTPAAPDASAGASSEAVVEAAQPELGAWGVDLAQMDRTIDPGDDFFRYVNGQWLESFEIPADRTRYGSFDMLGERTEKQVRAILEELAELSADSESVLSDDERKAGDFYASAMNVEAVNALGLEPIRSELARIAAIDNRAELVRVLGSAEQLGTSSPVRFTLGIDSLNPDVYLAYISLGGMSLPDRDFYLSDEDSMAAIRAGFVAHVERMLALADVADPKAAAQAVLSLETAIAEHQWTRADRRDRDKTYNVVAFSDLSERFPGFDWTSYFDAVGAEPERINFSHDTAMPPVFGLVNSVSLDDWRSYLTYALLRSSAAFLPEEFAEERFDFFGRTLRGQPEQSPRWRTAQSQVGGRAGLADAVSRAYVARHFPESSKVQMLDLIEAVQGAFAERIEKLDWMGAQTKAEARAKLAGFGVKIGYPEQWRDYSSIEIRRDDLAGNVKRVREYHRLDDLARIDQATDKAEWFMPAHVVNAYYAPQLNEIVFPAAILQPPFFDPNADSAVNFGGIGVVIGHELGHGFDDQGSKADARGIKRDWWTPADRARFVELSDVLVEQYNAYEPLPGVFLNGRVGLGENIGDLGGLSVAYAGFKRSMAGEDGIELDGFTPSQRFFLSFGQIWRSKTRDEALLAQVKSGRHSPAEFRVNGSVRNVDAWYEAFDVARDDALYLPSDERVRIW
ncbi:MAG: M13 family metallopeptidase [Pseudomonadaceae bacterium]|nr:M13 family metallopeptidase [Pseudomonadaceae bacterium]